MTEEQIAALKERLENAERVIRILAHNGSPSAIKYLGIYYDVKKLGSQSK